MLVNQKSHFVDVTLKCKLIHFFILFLKINLSSRKNDLKFVSASYSFEIPYTND